MADFFYTPTLGTDFRARDATDERQLARRRETAQAMREFGELAAAQGQSMGIDEWADMARRNMSFQDFMYGTAPSKTMLEQMRLAQNQAAEQQKELRRREQFTTDRREENDIRQIISDMALEGKSNEEIAAFVAQNFPERSGNIVPRIGAMTNAATLQARQQAFETYGRSFYDERSAQDFISANPGLNPAMRQAILEVARLNEAEIDQKAFTAGEQLGREYGFLPENEQFSRNYIDRMLPPTIQGERREQLIQRAMDAAREAYRAKLAGAQVGMGIEVQRADALDAPRQAERLFTIGQQEEQRRQQAAQGVLQQFAGVVEAQTQALGRYDARNKALAPHFNEISQLMSTLVFQNPDELIRAYMDGDRAKIERMKQQAKPVAEFMAQGRALSNLISGATRFKDGGEAAEAVAGMMSSANRTAIATSGALYGNEFLATQQETTRQTTGRRGGSRTTVDQDAVRQVSSARQALIRLEESLVDDSANMVLAARQALIENGSISMSPDELVSMSRGIIQRSVDAFVRSSNLPREQAEALRARLTEQAMARAMAEGNLGVGITRRPSPEEQLRSELGQISTSRNLQPGTGWLPSQAPGDVRAPGAGVTQPNQRWWQR